MTDYPLPTSPMAGILGSDPEAVAWIHPNAAYAYMSLGGMDRPNAAAALHELAEEISPRTKPAKETTGDFASVMAAINAEAVSAPSAAGESRDYQRGWDEAMAAVAAIAATYEPVFAYRATDGHVGWIETDAPSLSSMHRLGFTVERQIVGPWETVPRGSQS